MCRYKEQAVVALWTVPSKSGLFDSQCHCIWLLITVDIHAHSYSVLMAMYPGEPRLPSFPLDSPPFIPKLSILLGQA